MVNALDPSPWKAEAGGFFEFKARLIYRVPGQQWLRYIKKPSQKAKKRKNSKTPQVNEKKESENSSKPEEPHDSEQLHHHEKHGSAWI